MYIRNWLKDLSVYAIDKKIRRKRASILMYHSVGGNKHFFTVTPENFEWQMDYLKSHNFNIISFGQLAEKIINKQPLQDKTVAITLDDGYADNYSIVFPILKRHKIPVTIFLATGLVGGKKMVRDVPMEYLSWPQIEEMHRSGLIDFEPHSRNHKKLAELSAEEARIEMGSSKREIEDHLNKTCLFFAYPFGSYNQNVLGLVKNYFSAAVGVDRGFIDEHSDIFSLPRQSIDSRVDKLRFKLKI